MLTEADWEAIALDKFGDHGWQHLAGHQVAPGQKDGRASWADLPLPGRTLEAMGRLNPEVPREYLKEALARITEPTSQDAMRENRRIHEFLVDGYQGITYVDADGIEQSPTVRLVSHRVEDNDWLAVNQVTIRTREEERRFDVVLYLNGMPVIVVEMKNASDPGATLSKAHGQLATYLDEFPTAFRFCVLTIVSDGIHARYGTPFTPFNHYSPWNVDDSGEPVATTSDPADETLDLELQWLIDGLGNPERFLQMLRNFVAFDADGGGYTKRIAKPHQYFAVTKAVGTTVDAARSNGKAGVVWHTQGSGKSMEMELYAHLVAHRSELKNPTLVVVTDRTELDGQLYETFLRSELLGTPKRIATREDLRTELRERTTGGLYFTTLQKFGLSTSEREAGREHPLLCDRANVVVIVDEAHRSHYDEIDGFARHIRQALPKATFIAFTGTPIALAGRNTAEVFGDVIDTYDLTRAVADGATVPVRYAPRHVVVELDRSVSEEELDRAADEATAGLDDVERESVERSVAVINKVYGAPERLKKLAADLVAHWEERSAAMRGALSEPEHPSSGKAMVVCATRDICARLYEEIRVLRPDWHDDADDRGVMKVVFSGSASDPKPLQQHVRSGAATKLVQQRVKDPDDTLEIVIVKDMMLTGFDAPSLHTLYLDRPLKGALLMQTLARVNRTFRGKQDGLLVGYAPLVENLTKALKEYTADDRRTKPVGRDVDEAVELVSRLLDELDDVCSGYPWRTQWDGGDQSLVKAAIGLTNHLRSPSTPGSQVGDGEKSLGKRFRELSAQLARGWALAVGNDTLADRRDAARFYETVRVWMAKFDAQERADSGQPVPEEIQRLLSGLVDRSTATGEVVDIYEAAGMPKPSLADLGPDFLARAQQADHAHLAIEALRDTLTAESAKVARGNIVRQATFSKRLLELMNKYTNQQLTSAEVIAKLVELAREVAAEDDRGTSFDPPLSSDELAFFDAVSENDSAVQLQGEDVLAQIARELVEVVRRAVKTDWTVRDDVRAKLRWSIKKLLVKYRYPPDKQPDAIKLVIEQMEAMAPRYAA